MTQACCPSCGLRFARVAAVNLTACPQCGEPAQWVPSAEHVVGFRLWVDAESDSQAIAVAVAMTIHDPGGQPGL